MKIAVCVKQVPAIHEGIVDMQTGLIKREKMGTTTNIYDLSAVEAALRLKDIDNTSTVTLFTMGPKTAESTIRDCLAMGCDTGVLVSDTHFSGSDVLATSNALYEAIKKTQKFDLIICGKQSTDGDTSQVSGALAQRFNYHSISFVTAIKCTAHNEIQVQQDFLQYNQTLKVKLPCLISVDKDSFTPRHPSLKDKMQSRKKTILPLQLSDFENTDPSCYGINGSATKVVKTYIPTPVSKSSIRDFTAREAALLIDTEIQKIDRGVQN